MNSEEFQAAAFTEYWEQLTGTGLLSGFAFWCWADYRYIEAKPWAEHFAPADRAGVSDMCLREFPYRRTPVR